MQCVIAGLVDMYVLVGWCRLNVMFAFVQCWFAVMQIIFFIYVGK
jgi:hypothetical protein